jgi:flagellar assembly factor FliW
MMPPAVATSSTVSVETRFGAFDVREDAVIIDFPDGLPGFEKCRRFVLLSSPEIAPLWCLQGLDRPEPSFLAVDPTLVFPRYRRVLADADRARLGDDEAENLVWLVLVTIGDGETAVANLRAPVVINSRKMVGAQVIHPRGAYPIDYPLAWG